MDLLCIGAAHMDVKAYAMEAPFLHTSIPVRCATCFGGVVRNIAENLASLGARVGLVSRVGSDADGVALCGAMRLRGIDTQGISFSKMCATARYTALLTPEGDLFVALADMQIYDEMDPSLIKHSLQQYLTTPFWVVDANLPENTIQEVAANVVSQKLWAVAVSVPKIERFKPVLSCLDGLILNQEELYALTGEMSIEKGIEYLARKGVKHVVATVGAEGAYFFDGDTIGHRRPQKIDVVDVTGAGDAFSAGVVYAVSKGKSLFEGVEQGMELAAQILASNCSSLQV